MTSVLARIKIKGKNFEILVDLDKALRLRKGGGIGINEVLESDEIYYDSKKGLRASSSDLQDCFGTDDIYEIAKRIVEKGEIQMPVEYKHKIVDERKKKLIDFYAKNAVDPRTDKPYPPETITSALEKAGVKIDNKPIEQQLKEVTEDLKKVIPIKIKTKRIMVRIPAGYTGKIYGLLQEYKEKEDWLSDGSLEVVLSIPSGLQSEFYDRLNSATHGSAITEEIKE